MMGKGGGRADSGWGARVLARIWAGSAGRR
jgi:hypothetical protein